MASQLVILFGLILFFAASGYSYSIQSISCLKCPQNEVVIRHDLCCEPTCDDDCSDGSCRYYPSVGPNCVCKSGYVRYRGRCIRRKQCPKPCPTNTPCSCNTTTEATPCNVTPEPCSTTPTPTTTPTPCDTTPTPTTTPAPCDTTTTPQPCVTTSMPCNTTSNSCEPAEPCILLEEQIPVVRFCPPHSTYQSCTPCCQQTCQQDCATVRCVAGCSGEPTCVCDEGYVKYNRRCVPKSFCSFDRFGLFQTSLEK
ncbi:keratin-associated protein 9-2-like [Wyeomyia smithii]|uniref:keratin-associated protein 9-2-like n=1 Tax=Wyeomyia smithii TaxID=174621 RepID=UPI0024681A25|nr:keratin-associated protein 9-2-like [Wyeomyia smithii]